MSFIGSMFGNNQGGYKEQHANILQPSTVAQANEQYGNVQTGLGNQAAFLQAVQGQNGLQKQTDVFQQQQQLANQLQGQANGTGPNPALDQLNQQTANNTANQAALMAGARGTNGNAGLIARQAAMQGGANQQQAAGQAATMQAQQQIAAQGQLGQQQASMQGVAGNMAGMQSNATNAYTNSALNAQQNVLNGIAQQNNAAVGMASNINNTNASIAGQNIKDQNQMGAGVIQSAGSAAQTMMAHGGEVSGPRSKVGQHLCSGGLAMKSGGAVPGKAAVEGDSYSNDNVQAMLSPGEIVIPRHITQGSDAPKKAAAFVAAILAKKGLQK